jgi:hypothetical protein
VRVTKQQNARSAGDVNPEMVRGLLQHTPLSPAQTVIVALGPQLIAHRGALKEVEAVDVAIFADYEWRDAGQSFRVQFMPLPLSPLFRLLLVFPLRDGYRLILVDNEDAPLEPLRKLSVQLLGVLEVAGIDRKPL